MKNLFANFKIIRQSKVTFTGIIPFSLKKVSSGILSLLIVFSNLHAQTAYIYVHTKQLSEDINQSFTFSVSGGSTTVPNFTLTDQPLNIEPTDIGAGHGTGSGELWVVAGATQGANGSIYHRAVNSTVWNLVAGQAGSAIDGADLGHFLIVNTTGDAYVYNGSSFTRIYNHSTYGVNAVDIANNGSITSGVGFTAIVTSNGHVWKYSGNYSTTFTWSDITPVDNSGLPFLRLDINPSNNDIVLTDRGGNITKVNSSGGGLIYYGHSANIPWNQVPDVTVDGNGTMYSDQQDATGMDAVYRYNGSTWIEEPESGLHWYLTSSDAGQVWAIDGYTAVQHVDFPHPSTIYTRVGDGSGEWLDDERVQTSQNDNAIMILVIPGTYTIKEGSVANWNLQSIKVYDSTSGSSTNVAGNSATIVVSAGQVAHVLFVNGQVAPVLIPTSCGTPNIIQNFGSGAANTRGGPLTGLTDFHYYNNLAVNTTPDGYYSLTQNSSGNWANNTLTDHTGLSGGYFLMVNASYAPNEFYRQRVTGLIGGATYDFTFWAANLSTSSPLQPNILAGIADTASGAILGSVSTGSLPTDNAWHQYTFSITASTTTGDIFLQNNAPGGFGNDLAIDDISFTQSCSVLPINLTSFDALKQDRNVLLDWIISSNPSLDYFYIERSLDNGTTWVQIGKVSASGTNTQTQAYSFADDNPGNGLNLYRLKINDKSGNFVYSNIQQIIMQSDGSMNIMLYPNPVKNPGTLNIRLTGLRAGIYKISLVSSSGQTMEETTYQITNNGSASLAIPTPGVPLGTYVVIVKGNNQVLSKEFVIEN
jgi:hypothetical protein